MSVDPANAPGTRTCTTPAARPHAALPADAGACYSPGAGKPPLDTATIRFRARQQRRHLTGPEIDEQQILTRWTAKLHTGLWAHHDLAARHGPQGCQILRVGEDLTIRAW